MGAIDTVADTRKVKASGSLVAGGETEASRWSSETMPPSKKKAKGRPNKKAAEENEEETQDDEALSDPEMQAMLLQFLPSGDSADGGGLESRDAANSSFDTTGDQLESGPVFGEKERDAVEATPGRAGLKTTGLEPEDYSGSAERASVRPREEDPVGIGSNARPQDDVSKASVESTDEYHGAASAIRKQGGDEACEGSPFEGPPLLEHESDWMKNELVAKNELGTSKYTTSLPRVSKNKNKPSQSLETRVQGNPELPKKTKRKGTGEKRGPYKPRELPVVLVETRNSSANTFLRGKEGREEFPTGDESLTSQIDRFVDVIQPKDGYVNGANYKYKSGGDSPFSVDMEPSFDRELYSSARVGRDAVGIVDNQTDEENSQEQEHDYSEAMEEVSNLAPAFVRGTFFCFSALFVRQSVG